MHNTYLVHHGVKGMKWGVRHDKESSGTRKRKRLTTGQKVALGAIAAGAIIAGTAIASGKLNGRSDYVLTGKTVIQRITNPYETELNPDAFISFGKGDNKKYRGLIQPLLKERGFNSYKLKQYAVKDDKVKIAGEKTAYKIYKELGIGKEVGLGNSKKDYRTFNQAIVKIRESKYSEHGAYERFKEALKNKGYSGVLDSNDARLGNKYLRVKKPTILFDPNVLTEKSSELYGIKNKDVNKEIARQTYNGLLRDRLARNTSIGLIGGGSIGYIKSKDKDVKR